MLDERSVSMFTVGVRKSVVIELFGSVTALAVAVGVSTQAVSQWPEELTPRIRDRVTAAIARVLAPPKARRVPKAKASKKAA